MVGPGGDGIRQLEKDMGRIKLNVKSVTELLEPSQEGGKSLVGRRRFGRLA